MASLVDRIMVVIDASSSGAVSEMNKLQGSAKQTDSAFGNIGKTMKAGLVAGAAALVGTQLVQFLNDSVEAYADAAKGANDLAQATGGTVDEVSRMQAALEDAGVSADQSAGLLTKFTTNAGKNAKLLSDLNVEMVKGKDGNTDYAATMVLAVDAINKIGDAGKRNESLVALFGKAGATAFQDLAASGVSLADAMEAVSKYRVFDSDDVRRAVAYDDAMDSLHASVQSVQFGLGQALIPLLSTTAGAFAVLLDALNPVLGLLTEIPTETLVMIGGFVALNAAIQSTFVAGAVSAVGTFAATMATGFVAVGTGAVSMSTVVGGAMKAMSAALLANPATAVLVVLAAGFAAVQIASKHADDEVADMVPTLKDFEDQGYSTAAALSRTSAAWLDTASTWDKAAMQWENWGWAKNLATLGAYDAFTDDAAVATKNFEDKMSDLREEVGEYAFEAGMAQAAQKTLNDYLAEGVTGGEEFAAAARDAAEANREHEATTRASEAAMLAYDDSIFGVIGRMLELNDTSLEDAKSQLEGLSFTRVGSNWVDEAEVAAKDATSIILKELQSASEDAPGLDPVKFLQDLREGAPPEIQKVIDQMIADFQAAPITSQVGVALDPVAAGKTKTDLEGVAQDQTAAVTVDVVNNRGAKAAVDTIAADRTAEVMVDITNDKGAGSILDSLVHQRVAPIEVDITNDQGANWTLNNIARDRTAYIDIVLRGVEAARRSIGGIAPASAPGQHTTTPVQPVTNNWSVTINGANDPRATVRALDRYTRDNGRPQSVRVTA